MDDKKNKFRVLDDGAKIKTEPEIKTDLQKFLKDIPKLIEMYTGYAMHQKIKYDALVKAGFTKQEALDLCKFDFNS